jgi:hypothetical protein
LSYILAPWKPGPSSRRIPKPQGILKTSIVPVSAEYQIKKDKMFGLETSDKGKIMTNLGGNRGMDFLSST